MTNKQKQTLNYIRSYIALHKRSPTQQEIADHFGISKTSAWERCQSLIAQGLLIKPRPNTAADLIPTGVCPTCGVEVKA